MVVAEIYFRFFEHELEGVGFDGREFVVFESVGESVFQVLDRVEPDVSAIMYLRILKVDYS